MSVSTGSNASVAASAETVAAPMAASSHIVAWNARRSRERSTSTMPVPTAKYEPSQNASAIDG